VHWYTDGDMVRSANTLHPDDDDRGQAGTMVREVLDDAARERLVSNVAGHLRKGVTNRCWRVGSSTGRTWTGGSAKESRTPYARASGA
jgi:Catalase-related immune-responsive